ncbi:hypothetical protein BDN70DRAFT_939777 [Pholiota conissans]|uniref:CCHC-type domain-containing protein n=1 Tax=Pholiota conissans TaxID=109636 RepID=A0A9P5YJQ2_9AGAR|nr:hypothetical protein BDN70DRAFT_939777 [Pholiota conissans]
MSGGPSRITRQKSSHELKPYPTSPPPKGKGVTRTAQSGSRVNPSAAQQPRVEQTTIAELKAEPTETAPQQPVPVQPTLGPVHEETPLPPLPSYTTPLFPVDDGPLGSHEPIDRKPPDPEYPSDSESEDEMAARPKEINLNKPEPYDGDPAGYTDFANACRIYLAVNKGIYVTPMHKVAFVLSLLTKGDTKTWKNNWIKDNMDGDDLREGVTSDMLANDLRRTYYPTYSKEEAARALYNLRRKPGQTIENLNTKFKELANLAELENETQNLISMYQRAIGHAVLTKVMDKEDREDLDTIEKWYRAAAKRDNDYHHIQAVLEQTRPGGGTNNKQPQSRRFQYAPGNRFQSWRNQNPKRSYDPNAMDTSAGVIDVKAMSPEKLELYKKQACFQCGKPGHLARDCPDKPKIIFKRPNEESRNFTPRQGGFRRFPPRKPTAANIRSMIAKLDEEDRFNLIQEEINEHDSKVPDEEKLDPKKDF